jgi:ribose transport system ATP-binding protein
MSADTGEDLLCVKNLCKKNVYDNVSFELKKGEILGLYGMVGSGRTEVVRGILGAEKTDRGEIYVEGKKIRIRSPRDAVRNSIGYISEDRLEQGIMPNRSVRWNMTLPFIKKLTNMYRIKHEEEKEIVNIYIRKTKIVTPSDSVAIQTLSGGNQQKVIVCSWMETGSKILLFDEPTKGIDLQSKPDIYHMMRKLVGEGKGIILISSDLSEILELSDRILVFKNGGICARFGDVKQLKRNTVLRKALG